MISKVSQETLAEMIRSRAPCEPFHEQISRELGFIDYNGSVEIQLAVKRCSA